MVPILEVRIEQSSSDVTGVALLGSLPGNIRVRNHLVMRHARKSALLIG